MIQFCYFHFSKLLHSKNKFIFLHQNAQFLYKWKSWNSSLSHKFCRARLLIRESGYRQIRLKPFQNSIWKTTRSNRMKTVWNESTRNDTIRMKWNEMGWARRMQTIILIAHWIWFRNISVSLNVSIVMRTLFFSSFGCASEEFAMPLEKGLYSDFDVLSSVFFHPFQFSIVHWVHLNGLRRNAIEFVLNFKPESYSNVEQ